MRHSERLQLYTVVSSDAQLCLLFMAMTLDFLVWLVAQYVEP